MEYWPTTSTLPFDAAAWLSTIAVSVMAKSTWLAISAVNIEGVSGKTLGGVSGLSLAPTKAAPVVACCTPIRFDLIDCSSTVLPFFTSTPASDEK